MKTAAATAIADLPASGTVRDIPISRVRPSPFNKRTEFGDLSEFEPGIKIPALARPVSPDKQGRDVELVFGHRRLEGALKYSHPTMPIILRENMSDDDVLDAQVIEHLRKDPHPLEEATWFVTMHIERKRSVESIASKVGRSVSYIQGRLRLAKLPKAIQDLFQTGALDLGKTMLLTRIPDEQLMIKAAKDITGRHYVVSLSEARNIVQQQYMLLLKDAPFDVKDAALVARAGACTTCTKNTDTQTDLLGDVGAKGICTDLTCFNEKKETFVRIQVAKAKEAGKPVITGAEAKKFFPYGDDTFLDSAAGVRPEDKCYDDPKHRTYKQILGKDVAALTVMVQTPEGTLENVIPQRELVTALKDAGFKKISDAARQSGRPSTYDAETAKRRVRSSTMKEAYPAVLEKLAKAALTDQDVLRIAAVKLMARADSDVLKRNGIKSSKDLDKMKMPELRRLVVDISIQRESYDIQNDFPAPFVASCEVLGFDLSALHESKKPAKKPAKKKTKK